MFTSVILAALSLLFCLLIFIIYEPTSRSHQIHLDCSPNRISARHITRLIAAVLLKQIPNYGARIPKSNITASKVKLPLLEIRGQLEVDSNDKRRFDRAVSPPSSASPESPSHDVQQVDSDRVNPFFLVALTGPLVIAILAHRSCPVNPVGAVNTRNAISLDDAVFCGSWNAISSASRAGRLRFQARFGGPDGVGTRHRRGVEFDVVIEINVDGRRVMQQNLSFLQFSKRLAKQESRTAAESRKEEQARDGVSGPAIMLDVAGPRRWAGVCKDYNPIHVSPTMARLFGYRSVIAHGNHVAALAIEQLRSNQGNLAFATKLCWESTPRVRIEVSFVRPIVLPRTMQTEWVDLSDAGAEFNVMDSGKRFITGSFSPYMTTT